MYVGVNRPPPLITISIVRIPHVCGGEPANAEVGQAIDGVFPMYVGVNRYKINRTFAAEGIPHVCGGEPAAAVDYHINSSYSPCMWG